MESGNDLPTAANYPDGDRQQFCVSWNSHQSNMHNAFPKLLSSEQFVDVTLACDGGSIKCHKVVLSACSDYLERLLLDIPCTHPIIFLRDMRMWELQALVEFMYRGEVYVEQQQLAKLMQAAEALQVRGLSSQGHGNTPSESETAQSSTATSSTPSSPSKCQIMDNKNDDTTNNEIITSSSPPPSPPPPASSSSSSSSSSQQSQHHHHQQQQSHQQSHQQPHIPTTNFLDSSTTITPAIINNNHTTITPSTNNLPETPLSANNSDFGNIEHIEHNEALQHLEKALNSCEATMTEAPGMVKMEPDDTFIPQDKPYSISMVPTNNSSNCSTPNSPLLSIEGYQRRQRRSEAELKQASDMVVRGTTFQVASEKYNIPISTIRFYMDRKGILKRRKRGRGSANVGASISQPSSSGSPPYNMMNYRISESLNSSLQ